MTALAAAHPNEPQRRRDRGERKVLPHNAQAEASILGGIIIRNEVLRELATLETADFYEHKHRVVFDAIRNLEAAARPIDVTTLEVEIERAGKLEAIGGVAYLGELALRVPTADNVQAYAKVVRDHSLLRKTILLASDIVERGYDWEYEPDELLGELVAKGQEIDRGYRETSDRIPFLTISDSLDEIERLSRTPIFETPFDALNGVLGFGGLLAGQVYYLAGGTGFGKTSFVGRIVRHHAQNEGRALIAFWEMFAGYYTARMSAGVLGVHANLVLRNKIDRARIEEALPRDRIRFLDSPTLSTLERAVEYITRTTGTAPLVVIDYIQLLAEVVLAAMPRPDLRLATSQASGKLRELAKKTGAAIICVTAAGRAATKKLASDVRKAPARDLIDASKESGSIEFDGAGVIVLSVSDEKDGDENIATISVAKARFGETTHIDARYAGHTGEWRALDRVAKVIKVTPAPDDGSLAAAIVRVLKKDGPLGSKNQIWKGTGRTKAAVLSEVDAMLGTGALVLTAAGKIALPEQLNVEPAQAAMEALIREAQETQP